MDFSSLGQGEPTVIGVDDVVSNTLVHRSVLVAVFADDSRQVADVPRSGMGRSPGWGGFPAIANLVPGVAARARGVIFDVDEVGSGPELADKRILPIVAATVACPHPRDALPVQVKQTRVNQSRRGEVTQIEPHDAPARHGEAAIVPAPHFFPCRSRSDPIRGGIGQVTEVPRRSKGLASLAPGGLGAITDLEIGGLACVGIHSEIVGPANEPMCERTCVGRDPCIDRDSHRCVVLDLPCAV